MLEKYLNHDQYLFEKILKVIFLNNNQNIGIQFFSELFEKYLDKLNNNIELIRKSYIQQCKLWSTFDYNGKGLIKILEQYPDFLVDFIINLYDIENERQEDRSLSNIWSLDNIKEQIKQIFDHISEMKDNYYNDEHFVNCFFRNLKENLKIIADEFLVSYVGTSFKNHKKMNLIMNVVMNSRKEIFEMTLLKYLSLNWNQDDFSKISWINRPRLYSGEIDIYDFEATCWINIKNIIL